MPAQPIQPAPSSPFLTRRRVRASLGLLGAAALVGLSGSPAAAATVAQASATAVRVSVAGTPTDSGTFRSTHDGDRESTSGTNRPPASVPGGGVLSAGTLAQDARTRVQGGQGYSQACAGLAGDGATVVAVGEGSCLSGGQNLQLSAGDVDLTGLLSGFEVDGGDLPAPPGGTPLDPAQLETLTEALDDLIDQGSAALGDPGLFVDLGVVQSSCTSGPGTADGSASLVGTGAYAQFQGMRVDLVSLPVSPAPNTKVVTDLDALSEAVLAALREQLTTGLEGQLGPLAAVIDEAAAINAALDQVSDQLGPLEQNVLDLTLNKQVRPTRDSIVVTALDGQVLPAASDQLGASALALQIGESACGPSGQVATPTSPDPTPQPRPRPAPAPRTPTAVPAGVASAPEEGLSGSGLLGLAGLVLLAAGVAVRRPGTGR